MISEEQVRHVASLARLGLTDEEVGEMGSQLDAILDSIEKIRELDLADTPPTANPLNLSAPDAVDDLFAVPRID